MKIAVGSDHAGVELKKFVLSWLEKHGYDFEDMGPYNTESVDYPDYGYALAAHVAAGKAERGIALCGSGIGISIAVNRHPGARCALVSDPYSAALAREHNDANVLALGARLVGEDMAKACVTSFLAGHFAGGRHSPRVDKLGAPPFVKEPA